jgi:serine/threonine-protein kinase
MSEEPRALPFVRGEVLGGKYRVSRVVGEGGMGVVVEAVHVQLDERVALKFLRPEMLSMPDVVARFDREARAAVKLKSDHVARVTDVGKTQAGVPYMVMEYLEGKDLGETLAEQGPLPVAQAVEYIIQACEGIGEAHARGIVHRDVKPENLFLVKRDDGWRSVKVLDFGISKAVLVGPSGVDMSSKDTSAIMGSPHYMSPEQLRSTKTVDHRADVWSLGVVLFELLAGTMPFDETLEFTELVANILEVPHRRLRDLRGDAPIMLEAVVDRALEKDRNRRYQSTADLAVALLPFAPKRARATAERVTSITKAAGLTDPTFQVPPSDIPPPSPEALAMHLPNMTPPRVPNVTPAQSPMTTSNPSISGAVEAAMPQARRRWPIVAIAAGGVALVSLMAITAYGLSHVGDAKAAASAASAPNATPTVQSLAATAKKSTRRVLVVDPRDATVTVDGAHLSKDTPWIDGTHSVLLHVEAAGRASRDLTVTFETDEPLVIELPPLAATATAAVVTTAPVTTVAAVQQQQRPHTRPTASGAASSAPLPTESPTDVGY